MTTYTYYPKGTCSKQMEVDLEDGVIKDVRVLGGCNGNLQGISSLVRGMKAADAIERMGGIPAAPCVGRPRPLDSPSRYRARLPRSLCPR